MEMEFESTICNTLKQSPEKEMKLEYLEYSSKVNRRRQIEIWDKVQPWADHVLLRSELPKSGRSHLENQLDNKVLS